jgi:hypothetical protein
MLAVAVIAVMCGTVLAGGNPNVIAYISFDQTGNGAMWDEYTMYQYEGFSAYFCLANLDMGMTTVSFRLSDIAVEYPDFFLPPTFTNLLPGELAIGSWNTGITITSTECMSENPVVVGYLYLFPMAVGPCCLWILEHPDYPRWVVDCDSPGQVDLYDPWNVGIINGAICVTAVEDVTWGVIKALYR